MDSEVSSEGEPGIFAFFSIGISHMDIRPEVPGRYRRKLNVILKKPTVPCYVLGQLGKNEPYKNAITGKEIIDYAMQFLIDAHKIVGGCCVRIDCKDIDRLKSFYIDNGFEYIQKNEAGDLLQYIRLLDVNR